ncbi:hypothetical protein [Natrinema halophilum]|uniref:Uncharacterized protein n=1 Tax=Natrinema halophilum TaxID=1699371 RepID=A0A7D5K6I9_9EURY|nr:hypothetical protein [Natrinema halophilum]QLG49183.1 hypothetical protein HYG82_10105 [Natrinema halophilum]
MVHSDIAGTEDESWIAERLSTIDRYDLLLGSIPAAFAVTTLVSRMLNVPFEVAVLGGVAIAALALLDGLFFRPPTGLQGT